MHVAIPASLLITRGMCCPLLYVSEPQEEENIVRRLHGAALCDVCRKKVATHIGAVAIGS